MSEEDLRSRYELSRYRSERAGQDLRTAKNLYAADDLRAANNRAYYSIFHSLRAVLALDQFDSKKHSGIISEFRRRYLKKSVFPAIISKMIDSAFEIRNASDYDDMFIASKDETKAQIESAEYIFQQVTEFLGKSVEDYRSFLEKREGDSGARDLLLASLSSSDTLLTVNDCIRSERELMKIKWAIEEAQLPEDRKLYLKEMVVQGSEICRRGREKMESQM